jgi:peptidoglycan L-alanyl-D-glutamate endopeptidase CwlK
MKDQHTIERVALLHPKIREAATNAITEAEEGENIILRVVQGYRTFAEQQAIYNQGRTKLADEHGNKLSIVTYSGPGQSYHNYGLAVDIAPLINNGTALDWNYGFKKLVPYFEKYGFTWGGLFKHIDADHFENKMNYDWRQLIIMYQEKKFIPGTQYLQL